MVRSVVQAEQPRSVYAIHATANFCNSGFLVFDAHKNLAVVASGQQFCLHFALRCGTVSVTYRTVNFRYGAMRFS